MPPDIRRSQPAVSMLSRNRPTQKMHQFKHFVRQDSKQGHVLGLFEVQKGPGVDEPFGNVSVKDECDISFGEYSVQPVKILDQAISGHRRVFDERQDLFRTFQAV